MSSRRSTGRAPGLSVRLQALDEARELADGRLPEQALTSVDAVLERASTRRSLSEEHTVVGFFGATGSGKSSLFNAVTGQDLAAVAVRRPTTAEPLAAIWGAEGSEPLLDWLQVRRRHVLAEQVGRNPARNNAAREPAAGFILLDLPDFDSTALVHRQIVERLAGQVDVLVWVLDPQKYADAAVHHGFLQPLASHDAVTMIVLNQLDRLPEQDVEPVLGSLHAALAQDGLSTVPVFPVSAATGRGIEELRAAIRAVVDRRWAAEARLAADVSDAARRLGEAAGLGEEPAPAATVAKDSRHLLAERLAQAAAVDVVVEAVEKSYRRRAHARTGWPVLRWIGGLRPDPLRRLNLHRPEVEAALNRSSLPPPGPAQRAQADSAVRAFADAAGSGVPEPWRAAIRRAARASTNALPDAIDQAIASADLGARRNSWWWPVVGLLQWLALAAAVAGLLWLGLLFILGYLQLPVPQPPQVEGLPVPTLLLGAGVLLGIVLALASAVAARWVARGRARAARRRLRAAIAAVADRYVAAPVEAELARCIGFREALRTAQGG